MWWDALGKPNWYIRLVKDFKQLELRAEQQENDPNHKEIKGEAYTLVERALRENHVLLGVSGEDFDRERRPIDTIVIHHTKNSPGMTLDRLNAMQLLRIYGEYYANPTEDQRFLRGQPIWSGHFYNDRQVFWGYHWLIRTNGAAEQILGDQYVGWHAGNWSVNTRSIGICIDNDLSNEAPSKTVLNAVVGIIRRHYQDVPSANIIGHHDANFSTACPGNLFYAVWRQQLITALGSDIQ